MIISYTSFVSMFDLLLSASPECVGKAIAGGVLLRKYRPSEDEGIIKRHPPPPAHDRLLK